LRTAVTFVRDEATAFAFAPQDFVSHRHDRVVPSGVLEEGQGEERKFGLVDIGTGHELVTEFGSFPMRSGSSTAAAILEAYALEI